MRSTSALDEDPHGPRRGPPLDPRLLRASPAIRRYIAASVTIGTASALLLIAQAVLLAHAIARVFLEGTSLAAVWPALAWLGAIALARGLLAWVADTAAHRTSARAKRDLRRRLARHILAIGPARLGAEHTGELTLAATRGVDALDAYFARYLPQLVLSALVPVAVLAWVARTDAISAVILLATLPLVPFFGWLIGVASEAPARRQWQLLGSLAGHFLDVLQGLLTLRLFGRSGVQAEHIARSSEEQRRATIKTLRVAFLSAFALETLAAVATALVAVSIGLRLVDGRMTVAAGLAVLLLTPEVFLPLRQASAQFHASTEGMAAADRIFEVIAIPVSRPLPLPVAAPDPGAELIRFEDVSLAYEGRGSPASTRAPWRSTGNDVTAYAQGDVRSVVGLLAQDAHIFNITIGANIRLARPAATDEEVVDACDRAGLSPWLGTLPEGLDTRVGSGGALVSGGEGQRIALARALLAGRPILVLDEPTANLYPETGREVIEGLLSATQGGTVVVITHDLAAAARTDQIVVVDEGRRAEHGTHAELLALGGRYARMWGP